MSKSLRSKMLAFGLLAFGLLAPVNEAKAQNVLGEILRRMDAHNKALQSLRTDVVMEKFNSQLKITDKTSGNAKFVAKSAKNPRMVRLNWEKPTVEQMMVKGDDYELYRRSINTVYWGKTSNVTNGPGNNALAFLNMSRDQMKAVYDIVYLGADSVGSVKTWHLQLNPKDAKAYRQSEIWVDADGMPRQQKSIEKNGDTTTVTLSNIKKNDVLKSSEFDLDYPSNVKRIKN